MAYNNLDFDASVENVGQKFNPKEDLGRTIKYILTMNDFQFATQTLAETQSEWQDAIEAGNVFPLPYILENEDMSEDDVRQDFTGGDSLKVREGRQAEKGNILVSVADFAKLKSYNNKTWRLFEVDENGNILGTSSDGTVFQGFELADLDIGKMNRTIGDAKRLVGITMKHREPSESGKYLAVVRPLELTSSSWDPRDLDGLTDVEVTVNSSIATKIVVTATAYLKGVLITGFDQTTDWVLLDGGGSAQTISSVTDNGDGTYDLNGSGLVTGTVNLAASATLSQDGYAPKAAAAVTI